MNIECMDHGPQLQPKAGMNLNESEFRWVSFMNVFMWIFMEVK